MEANFIQLETKRLFIRDHRIEDLETHHNLFSNHIVMYYLSGIQTHTVEESRNNLMDAIHEMDSRTRSKYFFRMENKQTGEHIGEIGYTIIEVSPVGKKVELGSFIYESFWGNGYVTEAFEEIIRFAFTENGVDSITAGCFTENKGSEKVMRKCNMKKAKEYHQHTLHNGKCKDRVEYRLLKSEWEQGRSTYESINCR